MRISLLAFAFFLWQQISFAQIIHSSSDSLSFGNINVGDKDSIQITLSNTGSQNLQVNNVKFYTIYGDFPFSSSSTSFTITANGSNSIWIYFEPEHNIFHNSELVIFHNGKGGAKSIDIRGQGVFPNAYYNTTQNLEEQALKNALKARLAVNYNDRGYNGARDLMYGSIDNVNGQVECAYTGRTATFSTRAGANSNNFNTEHTFPQGFFNSNVPMRSDIHHLFPTDVTANSRRANLPFGIVSGSGTWSQGGSKLGNGVFEPRNTQKGRTARAMLYFVIRYQDYTGHFAPQQSLLLNWHNSYPPDSAEEQRNNDIFAVQNNRNPFVDYPQLVERISNFVGNSVAPVVRGIDITQSAIDFGTLVNQDSATFEYVIVNRGNQSLTFSNFNLSSTQFLRFASGFPSSVVVQPGDALILPIVFNSNSNTNLNETVSFNTSLVGSQSSLTIPIRGNSLLVGIDEAEISSFKIYPNPVQNVLNLENMPEGQKEIRIFDMKGKLILESASNRSRVQLDVSQLAKGSYILEMNREESMVFQK